MKLVLIRPRAVLLLLLAVVAVPAAGGCEKAVEDPPSVSELEPEEAAAQGAEFYCGYAARCVTGVEQCPTEDHDGDGGCKVVAGELDRSACETEVTAEFEEYFECAELSTADEAVLDACVLALRDNECSYDEVSESDARAEIFRRTETARTIDDLHFPEVCEEALVLLSDCIPSTGHTTPIPED